MKIVLSEKKTLSSLSKTKMKSLVAQSNRSKQDDSSTSDSTHSIQIRKETNLVLLEARVQK